MPKFLGLFSINGLTTFFGAVLVAVYGAGATFGFLLTLLTFGYWHKKNWVLLEFLPSMQLFNNPEHKPDDFFFKGELWGIYKIILFGWISDCGYHFFNLFFNHFW